jgi:hypothetical protein
MGVAAGTALRSRVSPTDDLWMKYIPDFLLEIIGG